MFRKLASYAVTSLLLISCCLLVASCAHSPSSMDKGEKNEQNQPFSLIRPAGGVFTNQAGFKIDFPPKSLNRETKIEVTPLTEKELPLPPPAGLNLLVSAGFSPEGIVFNSPVTITMPVKEKLEPGETFPLYVYNRKLDLWENTGVPGIVSASGNFITSGISNFNTFAFFRLFADNTPPAISFKDPDAGAADIAVNTEISFRIDDAETRVDLNSLNVVISGKNAIRRGTAQAGFQAAYNNYGANGYDVRIDPDNDFHYGQIVSVIINVSNLASPKPVSLLPHNYTFTCRSWSGASAMIQPRQNHTATRLNDGRVLVVGGNDEAGENLVSCEIFDPFDTTGALDGGWSDAPRLTRARAFHTATRLNDGRVLVVGGENPALGSLSSCEIFDPAKFASDPQSGWLAADSLKVGRSNHTATRLNDGRVLVVGGYVDGVYIASCEIFDPADTSKNPNGSWSVVDSLQTARYYHTATKLQDGRVLVVGGDNIAPGSLASCEIFDPADTSKTPDGSWSVTDSLKDARLWHTATLLADGRVLVAGGGSGSSAYLSSCEIFDPADTSKTPNGSWSVTDSLKDNRSSHTATLLADGRALVVGGYNASPDYLASCEIFDPADTSKTPDGSWSVTDSLSEMRSNHVVTKLNDNRLLVTGGNNIAPGYLAGCEIFSYDIPLDNNPPIITNTNPGENRTGVALDSDISFRISDPLTKTSSVSNVEKDSITVTIEGVNAIKNGVFQSGYSGKLVSDGNGGFFVKINPDADFTSSQTVDITVEAADLAPTPNVMERKSYSFTCINWSVIDSSETARYGHTSTTLDNGKVLVAGGKDNGNSLSTCELYDPAAGLWSKADSLGKSRSGHTATRLNDGRVLVTGGASAGFRYYLTSCEIFDASDKRGDQAGSWSDTASLATARFNHTATRLADGRVLVTGGYSYKDGNVFLSSCEVFDLYDVTSNSQGSWRPAADLAEARYGHTATLLNDGRVLVVGGKNARQTLAACEIFDPQDGTWSQAASLVTARSDHTATLLADGRVLVVGGKNANQALATCEIFDPLGGRWTTVDSLATARFNHTATRLPNGRVLVVGGSAGFGAHLSTCELFDPLDKAINPKGSWSPADSLTIERASHTASLLQDGRVLVVKGDTSSCEVYTNSYQKK